MGNREGNRRLVAALSIGAGLALALSGCSVTGSLAGSATASDSAAVSIGVQAISGASSGSASGSSGTSGAGWSSNIGCPDTFRQGILATSPAGATLTPLDAKTTTGVTADPDVFAGDIPNCAYALTESGHTVDAVVFVGMPDSDQQAIIAKLESDGFTGGSTSTELGGTIQIFSTSVSRIGVEKLTSAGVSFFALIG